MKRVPKYTLSQISAMLQILRICASNIGYSLNWDLAGKEGKGFRSWDLSVTVKTKGEAKCKPKRSKSKKSASKG